MADKSFKERAQALFKQSLVKDVPKPAQVVTIDAHSPLHNAFETLLRHNILSAPVWDGHQYIGFLDIRDLVSFVVFVYDEQKVQDNSRLQDLLLHGAEQFKMIGTDGVTVPYLARRHRFNPVHETEHLDKVVERLASGSAHRVPVIDEHGKVVNIISQSTVISLLAKKCVVVGDAFLSDNSPTVGEISLGSAPVLSVSKNESVINTFRILDTKNKSGVALVDTSGRLVGTTTGKDLGLFLKNPTLAALNRPIFEHLQAIRAQSVDDIRSPSIGVFEKDKLSRAVGLLAATTVHRVFVMDDETNYRPIRVISISDILKYLTH